jgi:predicted lipoprotein with Yx(FWY)xxD motif
MNKSIVGVIIALIVVVGGGYAIFHKSSKPESTASTTSKSSTKSNAPAVNNAVLITKTDSAVGQYLADPSGKALYTYDKDASGISNCTGSCLASWPAYVDKGATTGLPAGVGTIKRSDNGQVQYTYNGMPLYYFVSDSTGQVTGDSVENFSVAKPAAASSSQPASSPSAGSSSQPSGSNSSSPNSNY